MAVEDTSGAETGTATAQPAALAAAPALLRTFDGPTVMDDDEFGFSVALDGERVLIGARFDGPPGGRAGQAHLFDAGTGALLQSFDDPTVTGRDFFGGAVALDGERVLIGAQGDDTQGSEMGQAHLFDAATGALLRTFDDPTPTSGDAFGSSVALDGDRVLIGARFDDTQRSSAGQAHLFDATTGALLQTFDAPTPATADDFGASVALSGDRVLIGAQGDDTQGFSVGQAYLFDASTGALLQTFDDPTPANFDRFGWSVALSADLVLIGAAQTDTQGENVGQAHLFDASTGALVATFEDPTPTGSDGFGFSLALESDWVLIGARNDDTQGRDAGQAHLFQVPPNTPPVAVNDAAGTSAGGSVLIDVLANDTDPEDDPLAVTGAGAAAGRAAANGTVAVEGDALRYTPDPGVSGIDVFDYEVGDGRGGTDTGRVTVRVGSPEDTDGVIRGTSEPDALLIAQGAIYLGGGSADTFLLSRAPEENALSVIDGAPGDTLQIIEGLEIASVLAVSGALQFDLVNGARVQVLGADAMDFDVGGNVSTGDPGRITDFTAFLGQVLGLADPGDGLATGGFVTVSEDLLA